MVGDDVADFMAITLKEKYDIFSKDKSNVQEDTVSTRRVSAVFFWGEAFNIHNIVFSTVDILENNPDPVSNVGFLSSSRYASGCVYL